MLDIGSWSPTHFLDLSLLILAGLHWIKSLSVWTLHCDTRSYTETSVAPWTSYKCLYLSRLFSFQFKSCWQGKSVLSLLSLPLSRVFQGNPMFKKDLESQIVASYFFPHPLWWTRSFVTFGILSLTEEEHISQIRANERLVLLLLILLSFTDHTGWYIIWLTRQMSSFSPLLYI